MEFNAPYATSVAQKYIGTNAPLTILGWGVSGYVFLTPTVRTAVKVHRNVEGYATELRAYRQLKQARLNKLHGITIPVLRGFNDTLRCIEMDTVSAPFLLDFAGVLFAPPDFSPEVIEDWHQGIAERFGNNTSIVYRVHESLKALGLYYMDFRPSNLKLDGLPGLLPDDPPSEDIDDSWH